MADLIAQGEQSPQRWRRVLPEDDSVTLGRAAGYWAVAWDPLISRRHATLLWNGSQLTVTRLAKTRNPLFFRGKPCDHLTLQPGEHFVIGDTSFTLTVQRADVVADAPMPALTLNPAMCADILHLATS